MQKLVNKLKNRKGFTIIELIVVMAVIAILVMLAAPRFMGYTKDANVTAMKTDVNTLEKAVMQFALKNDDALPVGVPEVEVEATDVLDYKGETQVTGLDFDGDDTTELEELPTLNKIDETLIEKFVKSTKYPIEDYALIVDGDNVMEVIKIQALEDSTGAQWNGNYKSKAAPTE